MHKFTTYYFYQYRPVTRHKRQFCAVSPEPGRGEHGEFAHFAGQDDELGLAGDDRGLGADDIDVDGGADHVQGLFTGYFQFLRRLSER